VTVKGTPRAAFVLATRSASSAGRAPKGRGQEHRHTVTVGRSGHIGFENCPRKEIVATVTVPARPVAGKAVTYTVALHNLGATPCGPSSSAASSRRAPLTVGPCGILPALVRNAAGADIYPGPVVMNCPNEAFIDIPAHATVRATGIWPGTQAHLTGPTNTHTGPPALVTAAPPGHYRLVVGQRPSTISVPFTLVAAPGTGAAGGQ
jgi:hypothetical protein